MTEEVIIGIDLGTTHSLVSWVPAVEPQIIPGEPRAIVPSVVSRSENTWIVGDPARARRLEYPLSTIFSVKRLIGKSKEEVQDICESLPFPVVEGEHGNLLIEIENEKWSPEEISAEILKELKQRAENHLGQTIAKAVITVPAYFDDVQRASTRQAGELAGLDVVRLVNEPTAAALAYGLGDKNRGSIVVYDLGGGTFDVSVLSVEDGVFRVLATAGDTLLGGDDFDNLIMQFLTENIETREDPRFLQELRSIAERGKILLSSSEAVDLELTRPDGQVLKRRFTRQEFEQSIATLIDQTIESCRRALEDAKLSKDEIDEVILVGGSTRIPYVKKRVEEFFERTPHSELNPDEVVALGAGLQGFILAGGSREILLMDVTPLSLGLETVGGAMTRLIHRNTPIPAEASEEFTTSVDNQTGLDLHILQGERELASYNRSLGKFRLTGFPPLPAGIPKFKVTFRLDANGLLTVTSQEERSGAHLEVQLTPNRGLTDEDVEGMKKKAIEHSSQDLQKARKINISNEARVVLTNARKAFERVRGHLPESISSSEFEKMQSVADQLEQYLNEEDVVMIEVTHEELNTLCRPLADVLMTAVAQQVDSKKAS